VEDLKDEIRELRNRLDFLMDKEPMKTDLRATDSTLFDIQDALKDQMQGRHKTMEGLKRLSMLMNSA
jgi:hypothetical protein